MRLSGDESGAVAVLVTILLVVLFGAAAVAVDLGSAWETKRELVADTDAAALAAALELSTAGAAECSDAADDAPGTGDSDAYAEAESTLFANRDTTDSNDPSYRMTTFDTVCSTASSGYVTVASERDATTVFAGALGLGTSTPANASTASWGALGTSSNVSGVRPFGACYQPGPPPAGDPHVLSWLDAVNWGSATGNDPQTYPAYAALKGSGDVPGYTAGPVDFPAVNEADTWNSDQYGTYGVVHRLYFDNGEANACGSTTGNWGTLCFVGNCGEVDIRDWLENGYPGGIDLGGPSEGDEDCDPATSGLQPCDPKPGAFPNGGNPDANILKVLIADETEFPVLLYNTRVGTGSTAEYDPSGFLGMIIRGYGPINPGGQVRSTPGTPTFLDVQFTSLTTQGVVTPGGSPGGGPTGVSVVSLCSPDGPVTCN